MFTSKLRLIFSVLLVAVILPAYSLAQEGKSVDQSTKGIERGSKFYVAPMEGGFDTFFGCGTR